jgi:uncharacterized iron-regulated protein
VLAGCAAPRPETPPRPRIWDVAARRFVDEDALVARLAAARFRLLGEVHDNPAHHAIRAGLIRRIAATGAKPAVVFEQFDLEHAADLVAAQATAQGAGTSPDAEALASAGALDRKGWMWPLHEPVIAAALESRLPVRAGNLARADLMRAARTPAGTAIDAPWYARFAAAAWTPAQEATLRDDIVEGHCGKLPAAALPPIVRAQRIRDAAMAQAVADAGTTDGAILIAGDGHVRRDVGVPVYLDGASKDVVSVGLVETEPAEHDDYALSRRFAQSPPPYDFAWATDAVTREDPCAGVR